MESLVKITAVVVLVYLVVVTGCTVFQRSLMYFPSGDLPTPAAAGAPEMRVVTLVTDDGLELTSWYAPPSTRRGVIVYFQGNGGHIGHRIFKVRDFLDAGYGLLLVGYRGYGGNPGSPSEAGLFADGRAALAFLAGEGIAGEDIVLLGESLGTGVAVYLASERTVGAVILEAPFTSAADAGKRAYPFLPVNQLIYDRFDSLSRIDAVTAPLLVVHGERDNIIPVDLGRELFAAANEPKEGHFLARAGHNNMIDYGLLAIELEFLARRIDAR